MVNIGTLAKALDLITIFVVDVSVQSLVAWADPELGTGGLHPPPPGPENHKWLYRGCEFDPGRSHTFVEVDHEIISTVILLPSTDAFKKGCCQLQGKVCAQITG